MEQRGPMVTQTDHLQRQRPRHCLHQILKLDHLVKTMGVDEKVLVDGSDLILPLRGLQDRHIRSCDPPTGETINKPNSSRMDVNQFATHL